MKKTVWELRLRCDGKTLIQGDVEALHNEDGGYVRKYVFPGGDLIELELAKYDVVKKKPTQKRRRKK